MPIDRLDSLKISSGSVSPSTTAASLTSPQTPTYALGSDAGRHGSPHDALVENWIDFSQCCEEGPVVPVFTQEQQEEMGEGPDTLPLGPVYVRSDLVYPKPRATPAVSFLPLAAPTSFPTSPILVRPRRQAKLPAETAKKCFPCLDRQCPKTFDKKSTWEKHLLSHSGVRDYTCKYGCGKAFTLKSNASRHEKKCRMHSGAATPVADVHRSHPSTSSRRRNHVH